MRTIGMLASLCALSIGTNAGAATVSLSGIIANSCVLTVPLSGSLVADNTGTVLRSDAGVGARAASLTVVALGASPRLTFAAPVQSSPSGTSADSVEFSYSVAGSGASRGYAATGATATSNLIDTVAINGRMTRAAGFPTGTYGMTIEVTCGQ